MNSVKYFFIIFLTENLEEQYYYNYLLFVFKVTSKYFESTYEYL